MCGEIKLTYLLSIKLAVKLKDRKEEHFTVVLRKSQIAKRFFTKIYGFKTYCCNLETFSSKDAEAAIIAGKSRYYV